MLAYGTALFGIAWVVDRRGLSPRMARIAYPLSLAVYCSSWTFFGGVGTAATRGWDYLSIYLGPALVFLLAPGFLTKLVRLARDEGSSSIADFISARYGRSRSTAAIVAGTALVASIPYIALQLRSVTLSFGALVGIGGSVLVGPLVALLLATFAISFGARRYEVAGGNTGVVAAIAAESLIKLLCFVALGGFALTLLATMPAARITLPLTGFVEGFAPGALTPDFFVRTLLSACAILCLPRQFYVGILEASGPAAVRRARWPFIAYLAVISVMVLPLVLAGLAVLPADTRPDLYVLAVPLARDNDPMALLAFIGGFSAATAMVVAETIALSTMATNDLLAPLLLRRQTDGGEGDLGRRLLRVRRVIIAAIVAAALWYGTSIGDELSLASIGLIAFAGVAQFAPALIATVGWGFADTRAARGGLIGGVVVWAYCLLMPSVLGGFGASLAKASGGLLDPDALMRVALGSPLVNGTIWSLGVNIALMAGLHLYAARRRVFGGRHSVLDHVTTFGELKILVARFVGDAEAAEGLDPLSRDPGAPIDGRAARQAERLIAGVIGAPSARLIVTSSLAGSAMDVGDVVRLLDQRGRSLRFSRSLLSATLETIDPGVSVIDANLRLVAWNPRYVEMFDYPEDYVIAGRPIADLIRYNAERGECGPGGVEAHVSRRLAHLERGLPHSFERLRPSGRWIKTVGQAMPGGGYVQSFTDITAEKTAQAELEARVEARTHDLAQSNTMLDEARRHAETATRDKTRFLAAASHDLLQPLHAARLFCAALDEGKAPHQADLVRAIDGAIGSADTLLRALLDVSRLDAGGVVPKIEQFVLGDLIEELAAEFRPLAGERALNLASHPGAHIVATDRSLLRSILQNFLSNAVRYTPSGRIWIGARRRGGDVLVEVRDSGPGIAAGDRERIFAEFERVESKGSAGGGVGLGLAIVQRIAQLLDLRIELRSQPGAGSTFAVRVPLAAHATLPDRARTAPVLRDLPPGLRVLCLDNDAAILAALDAALRSRRCVPLLAATIEEAMTLAADEEPDVALIDFHLEVAQDGLDVAERLSAMAPAPAIALVTADRSAADDPRCAGITVLNKPVVPGELWAFLEQASAAAAAV
ncbi:hybrid sensor histidine kinase/response regulator [Sphingomonas sp. CFBP 13733]|uniref:hybrid sensor histidine kinase/response regulator n=1 Tax=Sphingomonas sp. CFBP 13733 TaxID=2775291 RepID=UPI00177E5FC2|nr:PAS-domain containing protein [Sphingomonas sp. CFBP 13733]MBD8638498.1 PAS domain-containing hybrid sensor histidine kinase/response regulator [Sphingomonas sp. CFBP 13733]